MDQDGRRNPVLDRSLLLTYFWSITLGPYSLDPQGKLSFGTTFSPSLLPTTLTFQAFIFDAAADYSVAATNGLEVRIQ